MSPKELVKGYEEFERENITFHSQNYPSIVNAIDNTIYKYSHLIFSTEETEKTKKVLYLSGYLTAIVNNFIVSNKLFVGGWHFQLEVLLRTQFELLNNLIALVYDETYFKYFTETDVVEENSLPFTPKQTHLVKAFKRISIENPTHGKLIQEMILEMEPIYKEFSKSVHGNFLHTTIISSQNEEDDRIFAFGGVTKPTSRTETNLKIIINYSQTVWAILKFKLTEQKIINLDEKDKELAAILFKT